MDLCVQGCARKRRIYGFTQAIDVYGSGALPTFVGAQPEQEMRMRANIVGGGGSQRGSCRVEVLVDATARVEIRGREGILRRAGREGNHHNGGGLSAWARCRRTWESFGSRECADAGASAWCRIRGIGEWR